MEAMYIIPRKKRRSVLMDESETDEEFQDKDDDFEMGGWCHAAQPETGSLAYLRT